jgi:acyl-CoA thioester hydrolase
MTKQSEFPCQIYVEDTDYTGVVYHANYLKYLERARTTLFNELGLSLRQQEQQGFLYVIRDITIQYLKPARLENKLLVKTALNAIGKTRLHFHQVIDNLTTDECQITSADIIVICVNQHIKPQPLPQSLLEKIND